MESPDRAGTGHYEEENISRHYALCLCALYRTGIIGGYGAADRRYYSTGPPKKVSTEDLETSKKRQNTFSLRQKVS